MIFFKSEKYMCVIETCHSIHVIVLTGTINPGLSQAVKNSRDINIYIILILWLFHIDRVVYTKEIKKTHFYRVQRY